jgi:hypothetical protein
MATVHKPTNSVAGQVPLSNDANGYLHAIDIRKGNISNVEMVSASATPNGSWAGMDEGAMGRETQGVTEKGRMEAKLQELELRKGELADLQAKADEDIKTLRNVLYILEA